MGSSEWISIGAALVSIAALVIGLIHRRDDIAREEAFFVRSRVSETLSGDSGVRSVDALDEDDGKTERRITLLGRTANQLDIAGAPELATSLRAVLAHPWGPGTTTQSREARDSFRRVVGDFLAPDRRRPGGGSRG